MLLKVGELARRSGLTIRTLHHYDEIGLVKPSARSESGYRLYDERDVARLHTVQALRQLGFGLARIGELLEGGEATPGQVVAEQIRAVDEEIARARALREQLVLLHEAMAAGAGPRPGLLLQTLALMATYSRHFSPRELKALFRHWQETRPSWLPLLEEVAEARRAGVAPDSPRAQALAQRWMDLVMELTAGDLPLALRWARMNEESPATARHQGTDPHALAFVRQAIELRLEALRRHLSPEEIERLDAGLARDWRAAVARVRQLMERPEAVGDDEARSLLDDWDRLTARMAHEDPALQARLVEAYRSEPLLQEGHVVPPDVRAFVEALRGRLKR